MMRLVPFSFLLVLYFSFDALAEEFPSKLDCHGFEGGFAFEISNYNTMEEELSQPWKSVASGKWEAKYIYAGDKEESTISLERNGKGLYTLSMTGPTRLKKFLLTYLIEDSPAYALASKLPSSTRYLDCEVSK